LAFDVRTPLSRLHRLQLPIDDDDEFSAGEWGEVTVVAGAQVFSPVTGVVTGPTYPVFQATSGRSDRSFTGNATVVYGIHIADTDQFDSTAVYSVNTPLTVEDGLLAPAAAGELIVAWVLIPPTANTEAPNHLRYTTDKWSVSP
jgi:hypothetical protein